jgi:hypothetical protein
MPFAPKFHILINGQSILISLGFAGLFGLVDWPVFISVEETTD